jgi:hypothetical protein
MKKKEKRKYIRSGKYKKQPSDAPQSTPDTPKEESSVIIPKKLTNTQIQELNQEIKDHYKGIENAHKPFTFEDLPLSIRTGVLRTIETRRILNLFDDSKERKQRALEYWRQNESL